MSRTLPFVDLDGGRLDYDQIRAEATPLAALVALVGGIALVPFLLAIVAGGGLRVLFTIVSQFVLAVGGGIVLMYVVARGIQLADG